MGINIDALLGLAGTLLGGTNITIKGKQIPVGQIINIYESNKPLFDSIFHSTPHVSVPAAQRPLVEGLPDDKIVVPVFVPPPAPVPGSVKDYSALRLNMAKAQYNQELFPDMYDEAKGGNKFGLYSPARQSVYNRRSKLWFNTTPLKKDGHEVEHDEGEADGILWGIEWHLFYNGHETIVKADHALLRDTPNGAQRPVQAVLGDSVAVGQAAWDYAESFLCQINVGENEGEYEVFARHTQLDITSETLHFSVS